MSSRDLAYLTATELVARYAKKELSPVDVTQAVLGRVDEADGAVNAFCLVDADAALASARESEERWRRGAPAGPVDGVPTSIKDMFVTRGWPTLRGSRTVDPGPEWAVDAPCVARRDLRGEYDESRTLWLQSQGIDVVRYTNTEIFENLDAVLEDLVKRCLTKVINSTE